MAKDPGHGRTEKDGSKSEKFCAYCDEGDVFQNPGFSAMDMQTVFVEQMKKQGTNSFLAWLFKRGNSPLERLR